MKRLMVSALMILALVVSGNTMLAPFLGADAGTAHAWGAGDVDSGGGNSDNDADGGDGGGDAGDSDGGDCGGGEA